MERKIDAIKTEITWFDGANFGRWQEEIDTKLATKGSQEEALKLVKVAINRFETNIIETRTNIGKSYNPLNWFDKDQKRLRANLEGLKQDLQDQENTQTGLTRNLVNLSEEITRASSQLERYTKFNRALAVENLSKLSEQNTSLQRELSEARTLMLDADKELLPVVTQIEECWANLQYTQAAVLEAAALKRDLENASNSYERAMVHQECTRKFGTPSPNRAIGEQEQRATWLGRDLGKLQARASGISRRVTRVIKKIVIDGNNMCYENGDKFCGVNPILKAARALRNRCAIIIVFDSSIQGLLKSNQQYIRARFAGYAEVHIAPSEHIADETIIEIASNDIHCFIVSNDRFAEYTDKEPVKGHRIIRHEIVDRKVIINDLQINEEFDLR